MTGRASDMFGMAIKMVGQKGLAQVRFCGVTILTGPTPFGHWQSEAAAGNLVVSGLMTRLTFETKAAHMDITTAGVKI
jgi:hypothetical protein